MGLLVYPNDQLTNGDVYEAISSLVKSPSEESESVCFFDEEQERVFEIWYDKNNNKIICECFKCNSPYCPEAFFPACGLDFTGITKVEENFYPPEYYELWNVHLVE